MRQHLAAVIELISIVTALGVVVSALLYSIAFSQFGLSYIAIASLADILRDSLRLLILVLGASVAVFPTYALLIPYIAHGSTRRRLTLSVVFGALNSLILLGGAYVIYAVSGLAFDEAFSNNSRALVFALGSFAAITSYFGARSLAPIIDEKFSLSMQLRGTGWNRVFLLIALMLSPFTMVYPVMMKQLEDGLQMRVHFSTLTICPGERRIVAWMGDTKAVIKCEKSGRYEVKIIA